MNDIWMMENISRNPISMFVMSPPRSKRKARDWYETQLTVGADVYHMEGYPEKTNPSL